MNPKPLLALLALLISAPSPAAPTDAEAEMEPEPTTVRLDSLTLEIRQAEAPAPEVPPQLHHAKPLSARKAAKVLDRLPPLEVPPADALPSLKPGPEPPGEARPVSTEPLGLSSIDPPPQLEVPPLGIWRYAPEGAVEDAQGVSVAFSQPMVAIQGYEAAAAPTVNIEPALPGAWRWIDPHTAILEPSEPLPGSTRFAIEVPAGTQSMLGGELPEALAWSFETPTLTLADWSPKGMPVLTQPWILLRFDQRIEPEALLPLISLQQDGTPVNAGLRLAAAAEAAEHHPRTEHLDTGTWMVLHAERPLETYSDYQVVLAAGLPSAEGPLTSPEPQGFDLTTTGPFTFVKSWCEPPRDSWRRRSDEPEPDLDAPCYPGSDVVLEFTNRVASAATPAFEPAIDDYDMQFDGERLRLKGTKLADQRYTISFGPDIKDRAGQRLEREHSFEIDVLPALEQDAQELEWGGDTVQGERLAILEPGGSGRYAFLSTLHRRLTVSVYAVRPEDYPAFREFQERFYDEHLGKPNNYWGLDRSTRDEDLAAEPPGRLVHSYDIPIADPQALQLHEVELAEALSDGLGHAVVVVRSAKPPREEHPEQVWYGNQTAEDNPLRGGLAAWVQSTDIGVSLLMDRAGGAALTTRLSDGAPLPEVSIAPVGAEGPVLGTSDAQGLARLEKRTLEGPRYLVARKGSDTAVVPWETRNEWNANPHRSLLWHVFDDRNLYRPGERVALKGWLRRVDRDEDGNVAVTPAGRRTITWTASDRQRNKLAEGTVEVRAGGLGGFDLSFELPEDIDLGQANVRFEIDLDEEEDRGLRGDAHSHYLRVEEFRRPEFEVSASFSEPWLIQGQSTVLEAQASYYTGGALMDTPVEWRARSWPAWFTPPGQQAYSFGWERTRFYGHGYGGIRVDGLERPMASGLTDRNGVHRLELRPAGDGLHTPMVLTAEAAISDVNRQQVASQARTIVHPGDRYVGTRLPRRFVRVGEALEVETIVTDIDGVPQLGHEVVVSLAPIDSDVPDKILLRQLTAPEEIEHPEGSRCVLVSSEEPQSCQLQPTDSGRMWLIATVTDDAGRTMAARRSVWVLGGAITSRDDTRSDRVILLPDRKELGVGDSVEILIRSPLDSGTGLLSVEAEGIVELHRFEIVDSSARVSLDLDERHAPNLYLNAVVLGRKAYARGEQYLNVDPRTQRLAVELEPDQPVLMPGDCGTVSVQVHDHAGAPITNAEVTVVMVDESVLALAGFQLPDPLRTFLPNKQRGVRWLQSRELVVLDKNLEQLAADLARLSQERRAPDNDGRYYSELMEAAAGAVGGSGGDNITVRSDFDPLALFAPTVRTDALGRATVPFELPDNLTRYRIYAVAAAGENRFGTGESSLTARKPLMVKPSLPRFLSYGDEAELPVVVQNLGDEPLKVDLVAQTAGLELTGVEGYRVALPPGERAELRFPAQATRTGLARVQVAAVSGRLDDAAELSLPVWLPATTEAQAVYGQLDSGGAVQPVAAPEGALQSYGGLTISTSTTAASELSEAARYLLDYPYGCSEQRASRLLAMAAITDIQQAVLPGDEAELEQIDELLQQDAMVLLSRQRSDGSFALWSSSSDRRYPFVDVHALHALWRAKQAGIELSSDPFWRGKRHLRELSDRIPEAYSPASRHAIQAYALYVRSLLGDDRQVFEDAYALLEEPGIEGLSLEACGWLLAALTSTSVDHDSAQVQEAKAQLLRHIDNRAVVTAAEARFTTRYEQDAHLLMHSQPRSDAVVLDALISAQPGSELVAKAMQGLMSARKQGRWRNTQENAFILLAGARYLRAYEGVEPDLSVKLWLGELYGGEQRYQGRSTELRELTLPIAALHEDSQALTLLHEGEGRLYYRIGMRWAPADLQLPPASHGFTVERTYEAVDDPADVRQDEDGTWHIRAGAMVRVQLTMRLPDRRFHVALVDPLPAGLEAQNPRLATTRKLDNAGSGWGWWWSWREHENMRDERMEAFATALSAGSYSWTYTALATTPGRFTAAPARAEEMYHSETFGRSGTDRVVVE